MLRLNITQGQVYELRHTVHQAVPHLMDELRRVLVAQTESSQQYAQERTLTKATGIVPLEYPLGSPVQVAPQSFDYSEVFRAHPTSSSLDVEFATLTGADFDFDVYEDIEESLDQHGALGY